MKKLLLLIIFFALTACAGTGTKNYSSINFEAPSDQAVLFIGRKNRYVASAALPKILLDGQEIAKLGIGEMERLNISAGSHKLQTKIGNILQLGTGGDAAAFVAEKGKKYFFIIDYDQKVLDIKHKNLFLPHKAMSKRNFVLLPLFELTKSWKHPKTNIKIANLINSLPIKDLRSIKQM